MELTLDNYKLFYKDWTLTHNATEGKYAYLRLGQAFWNEFHESIKNYDVKDHWSDLFYADTSNAFNMILEYMISIFGNDIVNEIYKYHNPSNH